MQEAVRHSTPDLEQYQDSAAMVAAIEAQSTRHETPCGNGHMVWRRWGAGSPVVLVHGGGGAWSHWIRNIVPLSRHYTVWAIDIPGLGESAAPEPLSIEAMADAVESGLRTLIFGDDPVSLVGFSFGTSIATMMAARLNSRANNLVLVAARFAPDPKRMRPRLMPWKKLEDPAARLAVHRQNLEILMIADPSNIDALAVYVQSTNTQRARVSRALLKYSPNEKLHEYLPRVRVQGRVTGISGQRDQSATFIMDKQESALHGIQPDARFHIIENAGHWVQYEAAERFNELLLAALAAGCAPAAR